MTEIEYLQKKLRDDFDVGTLSDCYELIEQIELWDKPELREFLAGLKKDFRFEVDKSESETGQKLLFRTDLFGALNYEEGE